MGARVSRLTYLFLCVSAGVLSGCGGSATIPAGTSATQDLPLAISTPTLALPPPPVGANQRWIEVDLALQIVRLRLGQEVIAEYPASSGVATSPETATTPGVYSVQQMIKGPIENVPGVFVSDILIYDMLNGMGIHSIPMDEGGRPLDSTLGVPASAGCVRVGVADAVFAFARLGMVIWIH